MDERADWQLGPTTTAGVENIKRRPAGNALM